VAGRDRVQCNLIAPFTPPGNGTLPEDARFIVATYLAQAAATFLLAGIFFGFHRIYRRSHLACWAYSWAALGVYLLLACSAFATIFHGPPGHPARLALAAFSQVAGYLQVTLLLSGTYGMVRGRPLPTWFVRGLPFAAALLIVPFALDPAAGGERLVLRFGVRSLLAGLAFVATAVLVRRSRHGEGLGSRVVVGAFLFYGLHLLHQFGLSVRQLLVGSAVFYGPYMGLVDFLAYLAIGLGTVIWLLEGERRRAEEAMVKVEHMAYHDALTGLANRQLFLERLEIDIAQAAREGRRIGVLFLDLDRLKVINDSLGHAVGDELLRAVAGRLKAQVRRGDTMARLGGDEFTILASALREPRDVQTVADKILLALRRPFEIRGQQLFVTTSIGVALFPDDGRDGETLLHHADIAMYHAKELGRDRCQGFLPVMNERALERLALENDLRRGLREGQLFLLYQPVMDLGSGGVIGVEALLRWRHPRRGVLGPEEFLHLAEPVALVDQLDEWILDTACAQVRSWQRQLGVRPRMAVNLSARPFQTPGLANQIGNLLRRHNLAPGDLELEITEGVAMENAERSLTTLRQLREMGVEVVLDDFGTGYSSLSYLRSFPVDKIKIDRSFIRDLTVDSGDEAITAAVIWVAHSLGIQVVAEGVETEAQRRFLQRAGCDLGQGFLFHPPLTPEDAAVVLRHAAADRVVVPGALGS